ncbi:MAG: HlyD family efflux transporter periplasmic adaptor subunit [Bacillota bacterium]|jgi:HlyD family secretion protein
MQRFPVRWAVIAVIILAIVGLGYWGVKAMVSEGEAKLVMATKPVTMGDIEVVVWGWGTLTAKEERDVITSAEGVVKEVFFEAGDPVTKGQVLATIDPGTLSMSIRSLELEIEGERLELARQFGVSPDQVENVDPSSALIVRSPMSGTISGLAVDAGSTAQGEVCKVVDDRRLIIKLQVPEFVYNAVKVGTPAAFTPKRFEGRVPGAVTRIDSVPVKTDQAYLYNVWVEIGNPGLLKVGDEGTVAFEAPGIEYQPSAKITSFGAQEAVTTAVSGRVKSVFVRDGQWVNEGDPILELEPGGALFQAMTLQLKFKEKLAELEDKKAMLSNLSVICPMDGVAFDKNITVGQTVGKGTRVTRVANFQEMNLMLRVDEIDVPKVQEGQEAQVMVWGREGQQSVPAVVSKIGASGDLRDGYSSFNITLSVQNPGFLRPGMGGEARIFVSKKEGVLLCPVEALYKEDNNWFVDVKTGENERTPVPVEVGAMNDMFAEIISGLTEGQEVVVGMTKDPNDPSMGGRPGMVIRRY